MTEQTDMFGEVSQAGVGGVRTPKHDRAILLFSSKGFVPQLSTHPVYYFKNKATGQEVKKHIDELVSEYEQELKEANRERARDRAHQARQ